MLMKGDGNYPQRVNRRETLGNRPPEIGTTGVPPQPPTFAALTSTKAAASASVSIEAEREPTSVSKGSTSSDATTTRRAFENLLGTVTAEIADDAALNMGERLSVVKL